MKNDSDAFTEWFCREFTGKPEKGAQYLILCFKQGSKDNVVWELLEQTGDKTYTLETFVKAAKIVLARKNGVA